MINLDNKPALKRLLSIRDTGVEALVPYTCDECPFGVYNDKSEINIRNKWDHSSYYRIHTEKAEYKCSLLNKDNIWGDNPECKDDDWRDRACEEVEFTNDD